jgi:hypothetical protein
VTIAIEKNVPLPDVKPRAEKVVPELMQMEILDSIYIPNAPNSIFPPISSIDVGLYGLQREKHFYCKYDDEGMRVWRVE